MAWDPEPVTYLVLRASGLRRHAGEVAFPGGVPEPEDANLWATARREAAEEVGIRDPVCWGRLSSMPLYTSEYRLVPFVARVEAGALEPDYQEVVRVFRVPLDEFLSAPDVAAIPYERNGIRCMSPVFPLGDSLLFGATAHTFWELCSVAARAWKRPLPELCVGPYQWSDLVPQKPSCAPGNEVPE